MEETNETNVEEVVEDVATETEESNEEVVEFTDTEEKETDSVEEEPAVPVKTFTEEEREAYANEKADAAVKSRLRRNNRKQEKENAKKDLLLQKLMAGMGKENIDEVDGEITDFYTKQGVELPKKRMSDRDMSILAKADAAEIIEDGDDEMLRVATELSAKGDKRTFRENIIFTEVYGAYTTNKSLKDLEKQGIDSNIMTDKDFKDFASKFGTSTPIVEIYELYQMKNGAVTKAPKSTGSTKTKPNTNAIKEFYTQEEISKFSLKDLDDPQLWAAVQKSMLGSKR